MPLQYGHRKDHGISLIEEHQTHTDMSVTLLPFTLATDSGEEGMTRLGKRDFSPPRHGWLCREGKGLKVSR